MAKMPKQRPGRSRQDYGTPVAFVSAVKAMLGIDEFDIDLAASAENTVAPKFYSQEENSLAQPWKVGTGWNWCNPPFSHIEPWVSKALDETVQFGAKTAMLLPASVGANWWYDWVDALAYVHFLNGRLTFLGETTCYPKDCALLLYAPFLKGGHNVWNWNWRGHE